MTCSIFSHVRGRSGLYKTRILPRQVLRTVPQKHITILSTFVAGLVYIRLICRSVKRNIDRTSKKCHRLCPLKQAHCTGSSLDHDAKSLTFFRMVLLRNSVVSLRLMPLSPDLEANVTLCVFHFSLTVWRIVRIVDLISFFPPLVVSFSYPY